MNLIIGIVCTFCLILGTMLWVRYFKDKKEMDEALVQYIKDQTEILNAMSKVNKIYNYEEGSQK